MLLLIDFSKAISLLILWGKEDTHKGALRVRIRLRAALKSTKAPDILQHHFSVLEKTKIFSFGDDAGEEVVFEGHYRETLCFL